MRQVRVAMLPALPQRRGALAAMAAVVLVAGMAPATGQPPRPRPTVAAGAGLRSARKELWPLAARPIPVLVTGIAAAAVELLHEPSARLAGARRPGTEGALPAVNAPICVAGVAPAAAGRPSQPPTVHAGAPGRRGLRRTGRPLDAMAPPVHLTHPTTPESEPAAGWVDPPTDAAGAGGHLSCCAPALPLDAVAAPVAVAGGAPLPPERRHVQPTDATGTGGHAAHRPSAVAACYDRPGAIMALPLPPRPARPPGRPQSPPLPVGDPHLDDPHSARLMLEA
jgi:hypothetical protein